MAYRGERALLPSAIERLQRPAARHDRADRDTVQGFLRLRYRSAAPVHVGTGSLALWPAAELPPQVSAALRRSADAGALPVREAARIGGRPGVPGSTLRGALRQRHARITRSCVGRGSGERGPRDGGPYHPALDACRGRELCPTCSVFGAPGFQSRLRVSDGLTPPDTAFSLAPVPTAAPRGRPADRGRGDPRGGDSRSGDGRRPGDGRRSEPRRDAGPGPGAGGPRWIEVIPAETLLTLELSVRHLRLEELGALLGALGCEPVSPLVCGAGRGLGFGQLYPEGLEVELYRPDGSLEEADVPSWRKAFEQSADRFPPGEAALLRELGSEL